MCVFKNWKLCRPAIKCPKGPTVVHFDVRNDKIILVGDRGGCVRKYLWDSAEAEQNLLGHISMILDFCLSKDGRLILTSDRDEKVRISRYPQTFIIENFCLGHTAFVNSVVYFTDTIIASAGKFLQYYYYFIWKNLGGDSTIRLWNLCDGKCVFATEKISKSPIRKLIYSEKLAKLAVIFEEESKIVFYNFVEKSDKSFDLSCDEVVEGFRDNVFDGLFDQNDRFWSVTR